MKNHVPLIAITMGDPAGVGPEVLLKAASLEAEELSRKCLILAVADESVLKYTADRLGTELEFNTLRKFHVDKIDPSRLNILDLNNVEPNTITPGRVDESTGRASVQYVIKAMALALEAQVDAVVTGPISKEAVNMAGYAYPGHTELMAEYAKVDDFAMMMAGGKVRVVLVTTHLALKDVSVKITKERVARIIRLAHRSLSRLEGRPPVIAVAALNPHAGEGGLHGKEEIEEIAPAVSLCAREGIMVHGPFPADSLFARVKGGEFDATVVMYHDQGLIPVKMEGFGSGINVTLGLPFIRTSVDHGVALDIAGKGVADPGSMRAAINYAVMMAEAREG